MTPFRFRIRARERLAIAGCFLLALAASAGAQTQTGKPDSVGGSAPSGSFALEPGDVLKVAVWREKDLSCQCAVDERARLTLPMLGVVHVAGIPWDVLRDSLLAQYQRQLKNPSVTLTPLRRVEVLGEVTKPGNYLADPTLSLAGLIALAGGATPNGDLHRVRVMRQGVLIVNSASVETLLLDAKVHSNDQIFVDRRPWLERNGAFVASALISTASILVALIRH